jgi:RNA-binding protein YhbY
VGRIKSLEVVQVIGKTLVLFSPHPDDPEIKLPAA